MKKWVIYHYPSSIYLQTEKYATQNCASYNFSCYKVTGKKKPARKKLEILLKDIMQDVNRWKRYTVSLDGKTEYH